MSKFPSPEELISYLDHGENIARVAAEVSNRLFGTALEIQAKADESPVTQADIQSEQAMRDYITSSFPGHQILGEEHGLSGDPDSPWKWVLDPIDGTKSFIHHIPLYTVLVALMYGDEPVLGVIYNPQTEELVKAGLGMGCWYNGEPSRVSDISRLEDSRLQNCDPTDFLRRMPGEAADLMSSVKFTRTWADAHAYLLVATGRAEIALDPIMNLWDIACIKPIILEAGGEFTDIKGRRELGDSCVASNGLVHEQVMKILGAKGYHRH